VASAEAFGAPALAAGIAAAGVASAEALGQPVVAATVMAAGVARHPEVVLLLDMESGADGSTTFTDISLSGRTVTANGNAQVDTALAKYGTRSCLFDGAGDYLQCGDSPQFYIGTADFTVELWAYTTAVADPQAIICLQLASAGDTLYLYRERSDHPTHPNRLRLSDSTLTRASAGGALAASAWVHIAWCRISGVHKLFVDGSLQSETWSAGGSPGGAYDPTAIRIGMHPLDVQPMAGSVDEVRITNGLARYTGNFTPPAAAFAVDEAPGAPALAATIGAAGIASAEVFGQPTVAAEGAAIEAAGIASAEAFGALDVAAIVAAAGIASAEAFGAAVVAATVGAAGISSAEAIGQPTVAGAGATIDVAGIASAEAFGLAALVLEIDCTGIVSAEALGQPVVDVGGAHGIDCAGIGSAEAFGACRVEPQATGYLPTGSFPVLKDLQRRAHRIDGVGAVQSAEAFGLPTVAVVLGAVAVVGGAQFGAARITRRPTRAQLIDEQMMLMS
jgi:hypothetical protein